MRFLWIFACLTTLLFAKIEHFKTIQSDFTQKVTNDQNKTIIYQGTFFATNDKKALWIYEKPVAKKIYFNNTRVLIIEPGIGYKEEREQYKDEVYELLQSAYAGIGGLKGSGFNSADDMVKNIPMWKLSRKDGKIVAGVLYKDKGGRKIVASFTDGSTEGKKQLADILKNEFSRSYTEVSEAALGFIKKVAGVETITKFAIPREKVKEMLKDRIVDIYIDAKELNYIDSTGLGTIIGIYKILKEDDKQIYMENLKPNVRKMFKITDLDQIISIKE